MVIGLTFSHLKIVHHHCIGYLLPKQVKARAAIRRYWHDKGEQKRGKKQKNINTTLWISLPDKPGQLGDISSLIGKS